MTTQELDKIRARYREVTNNWPEVYRDFVALLELVGALVPQLDHFGKIAGDFDRLCESLRSIKIAAKHPGYNWEAMNRDIDAALGIVGQQP